MKTFIKRLPLSLALGWLLFSCAPEEEEITPEPPAKVLDTEVEYTIKAGAHETNNPFKGIKASKIKFAVKFDQTAKYQTKDPNNQADINKLYGMSDCSTFHHVNSARFGWRWFNDELELHAYSYKNGKNSSTLVSAVDLDKWYTCEISLTDGKYVFQVGNIKVEHERSCNGEGEGYQLYPYFGGDELAPHQINILIKEIK